jgi:hypothetical protein
MLTSVELLSTLARLGRMSEQLDDVLPTARAEVMDLFAQCATVTHAGEIRRRADRVRRSARVAGLRHPRQDTGAQRRLEGFRVIP